MPARRVHAYLMSQAEVFLSKLSPQNHAKTFYLAGYAAHCHEPVVIQDQ